MKEAAITTSTPTIEWGSTTGKTRNLFRIIRDNKGTFHAKMGTMNERNGRDLTEAEHIKKNIQKNYTIKI